MVPVAGIRAIAMGDRRFGPVREEMNLELITIMVVNQSPDWFHPVSLTEERGDVAQANGAPQDRAFALDASRGHNGRKTVPRPGPPCLENVPVVRGWRSGNGDRDVAQRQATCSLAQMI